MPVIHPREEWIDPNGPPWDHTVNGRGVYYTCPGFRGWLDIKDAVIHYPGADWADMDFNNDGRVDLLDTRQIIRQMHKAYLMGERGYSLGYGFGIGQLGDIWEIRGWRNSNAANLGDRLHNHVGWNNYSISVLLIVDSDNPANPAQVEAANWLLDELVRKKGASLNLLWHGQGQATSCAGAGIINQVKMGAIGFNRSQPDREPVPPPPPGEDEMATTVFKPFDCDAQFIGQTDKNGVATTVWWADKARADAHIAAGAREDAGLSLGGFTNVVLLGPLPSGDTRHQWTGAEFFRVVS